MITCDKPPWGLVDESAKPTCKSFIPQGSFGLNGPYRKKQRTSTNINEPIFYMLHSFVSFVLSRTFHGPFLTPCLPSAEFEVSIHLMYVLVYFFCGCKTTFIRDPKSRGFHRFHAKHCGETRGRKIWENFPALRLLCSTSFSGVFWGTVKSCQISYSPKRRHSKQYIRWYDMSKKMFNGFTTVTKYG